MSKEKDMEISKYNQLIKSASDNKLLERIAQVAKEERDFRETFYSLTSEKEVVHNIQSITENCTPETRQQLIDFLTMYRGDSKKKLGVSDIMEYITTIEIYTNNRER